jgi:5-methylcytosine-specific restriction enzyme A
MKTTEIARPPGAPFVLFGEARQQMPFAPKKPCATPGCSSLVDSGRCQRCKDKGLGREQRPNFRRRGYTAEWDRARAAFLLENPYCANPFRDHHAFMLATVVNHKTPHKGNIVIFWDKSQWEPLCTRCHSRVTATFDGGFGRQIVKREAADG